MRDIVSAVRTTTGIQLYLFGSTGNRNNLLKDLISEISQSTLAFELGQPSQITFLPGHPKRLLTVDEILAIQEANLAIDDVLDGPGDEIFYALSDDNAVPFGQLGHYFMKRFWRFKEALDLDEAIRYYEEALFMLHANDYHYIEALLGLCTGFYHRHRLFGKRTDLQQLLKHLHMQRSIDLEVISWPNGIEGMS